ncbi:MCE family protein [Labilibacter sediminis]|nr:MCE family protein [Labilibacter sediminis]
MVKISKEIKVGVTVAVSLFILGWGINFLKGKDIFLSGYKLYGFYPRIDGLTEASPIYYKGFKIGSVRSIVLQEGGGDQFVVTMTIDEKIDFPKNSQAQIYSLDLMGSKGIRFLFGDSKELLQSNDTISTSITGGLADQVSQEVLPLKDKAENLIVKLDSVLTSLSGVFDDGNQGNLASGIEDFAGMMKNLNEISASINQTLKDDGALGNSLSNLDSFTEVLKDNGKVLTQMMTNLESVSGQLANARVDSLVGEMNTAMEAVNGVLTAMNEGDGTLGLLLSDEKLYNNLNEVAESLDRLLVDVRHQPKRYVNFSAVSFGGKKAEHEVVYGLVYKVMIAKSKSPLDLRGKELLKGQYVIEDRDGKYFIYTVGEEREYERISVLYGLLVDEYPEAEIIALENGEPVKVKSSLK